MGGVILIGLFILCLILFTIGCFYARKEYDLDAEVFKDDKEV